jgi:hypothetical protein
MAVTQTSTNKNPTATTTTTSPTTSPKKRKWARRLGIAAGVGVVGLIGMWWAVHRYPAFATFMVDGVRSVVGPKPIAWLEDRAYGAQDSYNRWKHKNDAPATYWKVPAKASSGLAFPSRPATSSSAAAAFPTNPDFPPKNITPPFSNVTADGDGQWIPVPDPVEPQAEPKMFKMLVHPDSKRGFALVAVVAVDLSRVEMMSVPGWGEPKSMAMKREERPGMVPEKDRPNLLASFNGGFQTVHGNWGMKTNGVVLAKPRRIGCTIAKFNDGSMRVSVWEHMADSESDMLFFRQTPPCLVEGGVINPATNMESNTGWGATVDRQTIIRRSAFGLNEKRTVAYYGMGDALSAGSLARAMKVAGAHDVAQLDVNFAYPRFFFYDGAQDKPPKVTEPLASVHGWRKDEYVTQAAYRDFFYLRRKAPGSKHLPAKRSRDSARWDGWMASTHPGTPHLQNQPDRWVQGGAATPTTQGAHLEAERSRCFSNCVPAVCLITVTQRHIITGIFAVLSLIEPVF